MARLIRWVPAAIWMSVIFYLSQQSGEELRTFLPLFHKLFPAMQSFDWGHFAAYFILALTFLWALGVKRLSLQGKLMVVMLCLVYGLTDEYHQSYVAGRSPDPLDIRNDVIGAGLAMLVVSLPPFNRLFARLMNPKKY